jgi:hypothetical protein
MGRTLAQPVRELTTLASDLLRRCDGDHGQVSVTYPAFGLQNVGAQAPFVRHCLEGGLVGVKGFVGGFPGSHLPDGIWAFLGTDRLAAPIAEHGPDLVLHGHAHAGASLERSARSPVYNVSVPVIVRDFWLFGLDISSRAGRRFTDAGPPSRSWRARTASGYPYIDSNRSS